MNLMICGLVYDRGQSGIAEYTRSLTKSLVKNNKVSILLLEQDAAEFPVSHQNLRVIRIANIFRIPLVSVLWHFLILPCYTLSSKADALILPAINRRMTLWSKIPTIGIVHDLSQYHIKTKYDPFRTFYVKYLLPIFVNSLDKLVAISHSTKADVIEHWKVSSHKITVLYNGYDKTLFNNTKDYSLNKVLSKYNITSPYIIYVSRIEHPGKNHVSLVKAFESLPKELRETYQVIFAGSDWNGSEAVKAVINESEAGSSFKCLGYVPNEDLPSLYRGAAAMVFPSLYEGFGIPLVEAMACGTVSLCSNQSALAEVAGSAALTFDPKDPNAISESIRSVLTNKTLRKNLISKGLKQSKRFCWDRLAQSICKQIQLIS